MIQREQYEHLLGESPNFLLIQEQVSELAPLNKPVLVIGKPVLVIGKPVLVIGKPVLVIGERGTGKELIAERLHFLSQRWDQPYIKTNCATFNENLLEYELFGHEIGAFTGASKLHIGRFERANSGKSVSRRIGVYIKCCAEKTITRNRIW